MGTATLFVARLLCVSGAATAIGCLVVVAALLANSPFTVLDDNPPLVVALGKVSQLGVAAGIVVAAIGEIIWLRAKKRPPTC